MPRTKRTLLYCLLSLGFACLCATESRARTISGCVIRDVDCDGVLEETDEGLEGVLVELLSADGSTVLAQTTSVNTTVPGFYEFLDLDGIEYLVRVGNVEGKTLTTIECLSESGACVDISSNPVRVDLDKATLRDKLNFLFCDDVCEGRIGNRVWEDRNANGCQDPGEPGIAGVAVTLGRRSGACDLPDATCETVETTTTNADGNYEFTGLCAGAYCVSFLTPDGFTRTTANAADCGAPSPANDPPSNVPVAPGDDGDSDCADDNTPICVDLPTDSSIDNTIDCGYLCVGRIGDFVWDDRNGNGCQDPGEPGVEGATVVLRGADCAGGVCTDEIATATTDANGFYIFENLCPGDYCVDFVLPDGLVPTIPNADCPLTGDGQETNSKCEVDLEGKPIPICVSLTPDAPENLNIDCGVCIPGEIGDHVWEDTNVNGCRDDGEPACLGVVVNLRRADCESGRCIGEPIRSTTIGESGAYLFEDLCPGDYCVEFLFPPGTSPTIANAVCSGGEENSACALDANGEPVPICVSVEPGESVLDIDCGCRTPKCDLTVEKTCLIDQPPTVTPFDCDGKVTQIRVRWDGSVEPVTVEVHEGGLDKSITQTIAGIMIGDVVSVDTVGFPNDVFWEILGPGGKVGDSKFHISCSDDEMDGPEDCGSRQGNGKGNDAGLLNDWILVGLDDGAGATFSCLDDDPTDDGDVDCGSESDCETLLAGVPDCETVEPESITWRYTGGACADSMNGQEEGKWKCSGAIDPAQEVLIVDEKDNVFSVAPGDTFTTSRDASKKFTLENDGGEQKLEIHVSCSQPLRLGDSFGALSIAELDGQDGSVEVTYCYTITNTGDTLQDVMVEDAKADLLETIPVLGQETVTLSKVVKVFETTTNTVTVSGLRSDGAECIAEDSSTVTVLGCLLSGGEFKISDDKIEWELFNDGPSVTIESIEVSWPDALGNLKKVKREGDTIYEDPKLPPPSATITEFEGNLDKRQIKAGEHKKLKFEFDSKATTVPADYEITVNFAEGCSVTFVPGDVPFTCDGKVTEIRVLWDGAVEPIDVVVHAGGLDKAITQTIAGVMIGDVVAVNTAGFPNDVFWELLGPDGKVGDSKFHISCSDDAMNGSEDCGNREGNGKGNDSGLVNDWILVGLNDGAGGDFDCGESGAAAAIRLPESVGPFVRGDTNGDGALDISDAVRTAAFLFLGESPVACLAAADMNVSGAVNISDAIATLQRLFRATPSATVAPLRGCGESVLETDRRLGCVDGGNCRR